MKRAVLLVGLVACGGTPVIRTLAEDWPQQTLDYVDTTVAWTRHVIMRGQLQQALELSGTFMSPDWRAAHAARDAANRGLTGAARDAVLAQARADMAGPYEVELLVATWDRRENDLDRGKKSIWRVVLIDTNGFEVEPIEIVKDKRPVEELRTDFPALTDFDTAYIARYPRTTQLLGPNVRVLKLRMSSVRGGVELVWALP